LKLWYHNNLEGGNFPLIEAAKVGGFDSVVVFVSATVTAVPGRSKRVTVTLTLLTTTSTGNGIGSGLSASGMARAYATRPRRSRIFLSAAP